MSPRRDDEPYSPNPVCAEAIARFNRCVEAEEPQRKAILAAKNFRAGNQWPEEVRLQRQGAPAIAGLAAQPARPCLTIDRISQPVRQVSNNVRAANFEIECSPVGDGADKDTAEIYKGWMRRIQNEARADGPIEWAADQAAEGGIGWFRLTSYYVNDTGFDQDIRIDRIPNNLSVYVDPAALKPTRSDAKFLFVTEDLPKDEFVRLYGQEHLSSLETFSSTGDDTGRLWVAEDTVRIAEYWRVDFDKIRVIEKDDGSVVEGDVPDELPEKEQGVKRSRVVYKPRVRWSKLTAVKELEKTEWAGTRIPFVPILGEELNVDGKPILRGVIEPAMDSQRMVNYTFSGAIEAIALAPKAPFVVAEGQIENYKQIWQTANTTNYSALPYTPVSLLGQPVPPPLRQSTEPAIQAMVLMMKSSEDGIKATTGIFDPSLGNTNPREKSGTAIEALQKQSELGQSNYQDNVTRALIYAGELMVELGPKILDRPGRIIQILQLDDTSQQVMIGQPFTPGPNGAPQPILHPQTQQPIQDPQQAAQFAQGLAKFYDLSKGKYGVTVTIGRDHATKREEASDVLGELIPHLPPPMQAAVTPEFIETLDFEGAGKIAAIARKTLPPELQPQNANQPQLPPQVMAQLQQIPQLQAALLQQKQIIESKQIEKSFDLQRAKFEKTGEMLLAQMNNAAKILIARITADKELSSHQVEATEEAKATGIQQAHDAYQAALDRAHELLASDQEHQQTMAQADQAHQQTLAQTAQAAALQPTPEPAQLGSPA